MTRVTILAVARRAPAWVREGFGEYSKRLPRELKLELIEITPARRGGGRPLDQLLEAEAEAIRKSLPKDGLFIALDEDGDTQSTLQLSVRLGEWLNGGTHVCFIIGGADGLHESIKKLAHEVWSLSSYTLPHALVRVLLAEQIYRAWCILRHHPYHRE